MPSSCQLCGASFTSHFHLLALLSCPTLMPLIATRAVLSEMETCLWHPLLNPPQWLPSVLRLVQVALMCLFVSPSLSGPTDSLSGLQAQESPQGPCALFSLQGLCCADSSARKFLLPQLVDSTSVGLSLSVSFLANLP